MRLGLDRKTSLLQTHPGALRSSCAHCLVLLSCKGPRRRPLRDWEPVMPAQQPDMFSFHDVRYHVHNKRTQCTWVLFATLLSAKLLVWTNRLERMEERAFEDDQPSGGARRDRTDDLMLAKHALSQLSYGPNLDGCEPDTIERRIEMVGLGGLEPPTSRLSSARSNQLSYKPEPPRATLISTTLQDTG